MAEYEINIQNRAYVHTLIKLVAYFCESGVTKTTAVVMLLANHMKLMNTPPLLSHSTCSDHYWRTAAELKQFESETLKHFSVWYTCALHSPVYKTIIPFQIFLLHLHRYCDILIVTQVSSTTESLYHYAIVVYCISIRSNYTIPTGQIIKCGAGQSFMTREWPKVRIMWRKMKSSVIMLEVPLLKPGNFALIISSHKM